MFVEAESPVGPIPFVRSPLGDANAKNVIPSLGEHTSEVLTEVGYSVEQISNLRQLGVL
jgi:crotonobetainyl-CoA:carnitine CoA-transferase CaiB-like acyl-CoA transferase